MKMKSLTSNIARDFILFLVGGTIYYLIEFIWKNFVSHGICHWSMFLLGGLCFLIIGGLNEYIPWEMGLPKQAVIGSIIITGLEFIFGIILNIWLKLNIWNYSTLPFNILGQVCLPFSIAWCFLSIIAIFLDDYLRWKWFGEEKPHYHLKTKKMGEPCN